MNRVEGTTSLVRRQRQRPRRRECKGEVLVAPAKRAAQTRKRNNSKSPRRVADPRSPTAHRPPPGRHPPDPYLHQPPRTSQAAPPPPARRHGREQEEEVGRLGGGGRHLRRPHARHARHPAEPGVPRLRRPAHPLPRYSKPPPSPSLSFDAPKRLNRCSPLLCAYEQFTPS